MTKFLFRGLLSLCSAAVLGLAGPAWAQTLTITDTTSTKATTCNLYTVPLGSTTMTFQPPGCLGLTESPPPAGTDPVFNLRFVPTTTTQPATGVQTVEVFVDASIDVPTNNSYSLTFNLCTSAQGCTTAGSGNWYFLRYAELGGAGVTPQDTVTTGSYTFTFQPGAHTSPTNLKSMGIGRMDVPSTPAFQGTRSVMFSLSGAQAATNVVTYTITGRQQLVGVDYDIAGNPIPSPSGPDYVALWCQNPVNATPTPGFGTGPCGAFEIPLGNCSSGMTGNNAITKAWLYALEDYVPTSQRLGRVWQVALPRDQAMIFRFKTGPATAFSEPYRPLSFYHDENANYGSMAPAFISLSETKCDFDYSKTTASGALNGCYVTSGYTATLLGRIYPTSSVPSPQQAFPSCPMKPDTIYYLNIRYENASTIGTRGTISCGDNQCGQIFQLN